jgi:hypothetical protein
MDDDVARLREQAERCFRLALSIADARANTELDKLGRELEAKAVRI